MHHNDGVMATFKKNINAYTTDGGWYTIAAPFVSYAPAGTMIGSKFDLYAYDEDADLEWYNYKKHTADFVMASGSGYLYAHKPNVTLRMSGVLSNGNSAETISLSYGNSNEVVKGFNLLGNPKAHEITYTKTDAVSDGYYYIDNGSAWTYTISNTVPAGRGFLVKANATGQSVTLNPQRRGENTDKEPYLCLGIGEDKVFVKLSDGVSMPLVDLNEEHAPFYLLRDRQPYVMLVRDGAASFVLCYEARHAGRHTLEVQTEGLGLDYLHFIDRLTGTDIDLLATPAYTFEARPTDSEARFVLLFNEGSGVQKTEVK